MPKEEKKKKSDPFKTRKARVSESPSNDTITPPAEIAAAIDQFRECQDQAKHFEGEATVYKDQILRFGEEEYTKRLNAGTNKSFKILGEETMVTYIVTESSAGLTDEDAAEIEKRWGKKAAETLIKRDYGSIRFDAEILEANYDAVVEALQELPDEVLAKLFKPMLMKAAPSAAENAKQFAKNQTDLRALIKALKIKNYIK